MSQDGDSILRNSSIKVVGEVEPGKTPESGNIIIQIYGWEGSEENTEKKRKETKNCICVNSRKRETIIFFHDVDS